MGRFELPTSPTRKERSTKLSHIPADKDGTSARSWNGSHAQVDFEVVGRPGARNWPGLELDHHSIPGGLDALGTE